MSPPPVATWLTALGDAALHVAATALGSPGALGDTPARPPRLPGAFVPIAAGEASVQIGVVGESTALHALATALLGVAPAAVASGDVVDAIGEIANMLAGGVKTRMLAHIRPVVIGLPVFVHGWIDPGERLTAIYQPLHIADIAVHVALLLPRG